MHNGAKKTGHTLTRFAALVLLAVTLFACGSDGPAAVFTDTDSGNEIGLDSGDEFELRLESNPSTGFEWQIDSASQTDFLKLVSSDFEAADTDLVGAPGTQVLLFSASESGAGVLRLTYARPFDDPPIPERIAEYIVRVDGVEFTRSTDSPPQTDTATHNDGTIAGLLADSTPRAVTVSGFVIWEDGGARLCSVIMESFPPQCGEPAVVIENPEQLDVQLQEAQGVRWTDQLIEVSGDFDGEQLIVAK